MGENRIEVLQVERAFQEAVAEDITEAQDRALSLLDELRTLDDVLTRTDILAPADGDILNMQFTTVGGVIPGGQPILDIIPLGDELVVDVQIPQNDIDNVVVGQDVRMTIAALNPRTTPELIGTVTSVAADAVTDQATGIPFFPARVAFKPDELSRLGGQSLRPGMAVQVFIRGGTRSPMDYFIQPIRETLNRALRES